MIANSVVSVDGLSAYLSRPVGGSDRGMLLLPMLSGIADLIRAWADELAGLGVTALSWDPWAGRAGSDETPMEVLLGWLAELDDETALSEQARLLDHLFGELECRRVGAIGWCLGGRFSLLLGGREPRLANVVAYHPEVPLPPAPNHTIDAAQACEGITAPAMVLYPGADDLVPEESFQRIQSALHSRTTGPSLIHFYPGAEHGFSGRTRHDSEVNAEAFEISWPQVLAFIAATTRSD